MRITTQVRAGAPVVTAASPGPAPADALRLPSEVLVPGGPFTMGTSTEPWALDNERPAHTVEVAPFYLDTTPVTCGAYAQFIDDGGYDDRRWWPATGLTRRYPWGNADPDTSHANLGQAFLRPASAGSYPEGAAPCGARQLIGDVWEWTSSDFEPYPGFEAWPYKEYSEVFFGPEYKVLRGGSFAVSPVACRGTFRNWDYPIRRQIFSGFRTARSG